MYFFKLIGIPVTSDPTPFMESLFMYFLERKLLLQIKKSNLKKADKFSNIFRFMINLCFFNNGESEMMNLKRITKIFSGTLKGQ